MGNKGHIINIGNKKIFLMAGIFDFLDKENFTELKKACEEARKENAQFFVGIYSDECLKEEGRTKEVVQGLKEENRINLVESIDFVDGVITINSLTDENREKRIEESIKAKLFDKAMELEESSASSVDKKYKVGYASGAFSNLHSGHIEHLQDMRSQCKTVIVAANSDNLISRYKNKNATVDEDTRREILSHIKHVDVAIISDEYDKLKAISTVKNLCGNAFDAIFVGSDWKGDPKWEQFEKQLNKMGIDVVFTDRPKDGISTTKIDKSKVERNKTETKNNREIVEL